MPARGYGLPKGQRRDTPDQQLRNARDRPGGGARYNADGGVQFLSDPKVETDTVIDQSLAGSFGDWSHYVGVVFGLRF